MGEAYLRILRKTRWRQNRQYILFLDIAHFCQLNRSSRLRIQPDKSHAHQTGEYRDVDLLQEKLQLLGHPLLNV